MKIQAGSQGVTRQDSVRRRNAALGEGVLWGHRGAASLGAEQEDLTEDTGRQPCTGAMAPLLMGFPGGLRDQTRGHTTPCTRAFTLASV